MSTNIDRDEYVRLLEQQNNVLRAENAELRRLSPGGAGPDPVAFERGASQAREKYSVTREEPVTGMGVDNARDRAKARYANRPKFSDGSGTYVTYN